MSPLHELQGKTPNEVYPPPSRFPLYVHILIYTYINCYCREIPVGECVEKLQGITADRIGIVSLRCDRYSGLFST